VNIRILFHIRGLGLQFSKECLLDESGTIRIGRIDDNHISIEDDQISRHHLLLQYQNRVLLVQDLNSRAGTWYQSQRMTEPFILEPGEVIQIGASELCYELADSQLQASGPLANSASHPPLEWDDSLRFYLDQDLSPHRRRKELQTPDQMVKLLLRTLFVPFIVLFTLFILFPSFISCLITLGYAGIALALSNNLLSRTNQRESLSLPITREISRMQRQILRSVQKLPKIERHLISDMVNEINRFVKGRLPGMENDIYTLNQSLLPGMGERLERKKFAVEEKLSQKLDRRIRAQLRKSLNIIKKQMKLHTKIRNLLMGLILKLEDFRSQLEILEGTLVAQGFVEIPKEFTSHFLELQEDIDKFYEEYRQLDRLEI
jgi:hypothetical protein